MAGNIVPPSYIWSAVSKLLACISAICASLSRLCSLRAWLVLSSRVLPLLMMLVGSSEVAAPSEAAQISAESNAQYLLVTSERCW